MEPLSSIAAAIAGLLGLATAATNLVTAIRSRTRQSRDHDQQHSEDGRQPGR